MKVLAVDIGTGTQDILFYDSELDLENGYKLIVPSPTMIFHRRIRRATCERRPILLTGVMMGGGPVSWAAKDHLGAGLSLYATPQAARTFDDNLETVQKEMGVTVIAEDEVAKLSDDVLRLDLKDFDFEMLASALGQFGVTLRPDLLALGVFDHGNSPPGYSDRQFRFDFLHETIRAKGSLSAFAHRAEQIPKIMTRLRAVRESARDLDFPLMVMDTAPAAVLGATLDPRVGARVDGDGALIANIGNMHTLVFRLSQSRIEGVFEHHTGVLSTDRLDELIEKLAEGKILHSDVFNDRGHGALVMCPAPLPMPKDDFGVAITGPRRNLMRASRHRAYYAVPFGDMMMAGCFGMLRAAADVFPEYAEPILDSLSGAGGHAPWELE